MTGSGERLTLDGADADDLRLLDADGRRFRLQIDDELRDAVRRSARASASATTAGPEEVSMDTSLRPRDIQARIRAGATAEEVAEVAGSTVEKVLVYAGPVLAERAHMAQRAQRSSVRGHGGDGATGHRTLGDAVAKRLRALNEDPTGVEWDSRKREDGRWVLSASYATQERSGLGRFTFDPPGNFVTTDDEDARWLLGDDQKPEIDAPGLERQPPGDGTAADGPRLVAVADGELPLGDALRLVGDPDGNGGAPDGVETYAVGADATDTADLTETAESLRAPADDPDDHAAADGADKPDGPAKPQDTAKPEDTGDTEEPDEAPARRRVRKRGGRASVPSWDEIMFGGGRKD